MTRSAAAAALAGLVGALCACQGAAPSAAVSQRPSSTATAAHAASQRPSGTPSPSGSAVASIPSPPSPGPVSPAHLTIVGSTSSRIDSTQSRGSCGAGPVGYSAALGFLLNGERYVLSMELADYHGPDQYPIPPERVSLHTETGAPNPSLAAAVSGSVMVAPDQRSGSIDAWLSDGSHVSGSWACGTT